MPLITHKTPNTWEELEELVTAILNECGMYARRSVTIDSPRGKNDVDVYAEENIDGIVQSIICECKNWKSNIPKNSVHAFRTVMEETGVHRGYIISKVGFQTGAKEAVASTNIDLLTFNDFQNKYFDKWIHKRIWAIEKEFSGFKVYYEPIGPPGYSKLKSEEERIAYDAVWDEYLFAGLMLQPFSPYIRMHTEYPFLELPFDISELESREIRIPEDIRTAMGYREFFEILQEYARSGLAALQEVNPITRGKSPE